MERSAMSAFVGELSLHVSEVNGNAAEIDVECVSKCRFFQSKRPYGEVAGMF